MVENDENNNIGKFEVSSKFMRILLVIITAVLIFAGPTYFSYLLFEVLNVNYIASIAAGIALFIAGLLLMLFLVRKEIIT